MDKTGLSTINAFSAILVDKIISIHQNKFGTLVDKNLNVNPPGEFLSGDAPEKLKKQCGFSAFDGEKGDMDWTWCAFYDSRMFFVLF